MRSLLQRSAARCARPAAAAAVAAGLCLPTVGWAQVKVKVLPDGSRMIYNDAPAPRRSAGGGAPTVSPRLTRLIEQHAARTGLATDLVRAVVQVESAFNAWARSSKGAMGLMQLMPATARELGVHDPYDPDENIRAGTTYLRRMLDRFRGDLRLALAAYNAGPTAVDRHRGIPPFSETRNYVAKVLRLLAGRDALRAPVARAKADGEVSPRPQVRGAPVYVVRDANDQLIFTTQAPGPN